eukprot:922741-Alexandrium_andersonii.AAC.1
MVRMLRSAKADESVLEKARRFQCDLCRAHQAPKIVRPSQVPHGVAPLRYVHMDVKHLPGWQDGSRIKALNVIDDASSMQSMTPFRETEGSQ